MVVATRWNTGADLGRAWSNAEQKAATPAHSYMEEQHSAAIYAFTQVAGQPGSTSLTAAGQQLSAETQALFSSLGDAVRILKLSQRLCHDTSYTTDAPLDPSVSRKLLRFGTFVLGSDGPHRRASAHFEVHTCFGADVTHYSALKQKKQVLIPPYEVFRVSEGHAGPRQGERTYRLESNLNCVFDGGSGSLHPISASRLGFGVVCVVIVFHLLLFVIFKVRYLVSKMCLKPFGSSLEANEIRRSDCKKPSFSLEQAWEL